MNSDYDSLASLLAPTHTQSSTFNNSNTQEPKSRISNTVAKKKQVGYISGPIWELDELCEFNEILDMNDDRIQPEYTIRFGQNVSTSDMFLGLDEKTPSTGMHSDFLVLSIQMPLVGELGMNDIQIDCKQEIISVRSTKYKLVVPLPQPVSDLNGSATWDKSSYVLTIKLPLRRNVY